MTYNISGIQQVGIGVTNLDEVWSWYAKHFGMDLPIFNDEAEAALMIDYTGNKIQKRRAVLAMNLQGGGGFEVWQFTSRKSAPRKVETKEGDLGINSVHMRVYDVQKTYNYFKELGEISLSEIQKNDLGKNFFELKDPFGNSFKLIEDQYLFRNTGHLMGGVIGVTIGVSNMSKSLPLYQKGMKQTAILSDKTGEKGFQRVWLENTAVKPSAFGELLGPIKIELVCDTKNKREKIYRGRYWGDQGFIHVCFDVQNMEVLREQCNTLNHPFTVDSANSFDMGEAAGQFAYVEDTDGTLIELVETHKVPILKKIGWYINLKKKKVQKPLLFYSHHLLLIWEKKSGKFVVNQILLLTPIGQNLIQH